MHDARNRRIVTIRAPGKGIRCSRDGVCEIVSSWVEAANGTDDPGRPEHLRAIGACVTFGESIGRNKQRVAVAERQYPVVKRRPLDHAEGGSGRIQMNVLATAKEKGEIVTGRRVRNRSRGPIESRHERAGEHVCVGGDSRGVESGKNARGVIARACFNEEALEQHLDVASRNGSL
jgi:hypothetical protein